MSKPLIVVTGAAGYIGSHTVIELLESGRYDVAGIDNYSNSTAATYERIKAITGKSVPHFETDLCDLDACRKVFAALGKVEGIIHFAAHKSVPESVHYPSRYYRNNLVSLLNMLDCCSEFNIRHFIFSSSCSVYGNISTLPVSELTPLQKVESPYASTKVIGEQIVVDTVTSGAGLRAVLLRYFNPVGAHPSALNGELPVNTPNNLVPIITRSAIGLIPQVTVYGNDYDTRDGTCVRDYIHVCDIARAHLLALDASAGGKLEAACELFNLGSGTGVTVLEAIHAFEKASNRKLAYTIGPRRAGDIAAIYADSSKAEKMLGWKPQFGIDVMMDSAWKWELQLEREREKN